MLDQRASWPIALRARLGAGRPALLPRDNPGDRISRVEPRTVESSRPARQQGPVGTGQKSGSRVARDRELPLIVGDQ